MYDTLSVAERNVRNKYGSRLQKNKLYLKNGSDRNKYRITKTIIHNY